MLLAIKTFKIDYYNRHWIKRVLFPEQEITFTIFLYRGPNAYIVLYPDIAKSVFTKEFADKLISIQVKLCLLGEC